MNYLPTKKTPLIAAHRGSAGGNIACNSESAYKAALYQGADIIETDVSVSLDRKLFAFHPFKEHAHLNLPVPIRLLTAKQVALKRYLNQDNVSTGERVLTLDDALEILKDKCIVNIDKFWTAPKEISNCIRKHGMTKQVIIKTPANEKYFKAVEEFAHDMPFMVMVKENDNVTESLLKRKVNYIGVEAIFKTEAAQIISDEHIDYLHKTGLVIWGNSIVYKRNNVISAGHTDDIAITGDPDHGWGWFRDKSFDILQTDWVSDVKKYFESK